MTLGCLLSGLWLKPPCLPRPLLLEALGFGGFPVKPSEHQAFAQAVPSSWSALSPAAATLSECSASLRRHRGQTLSHTSYPLAAGQGVIRVTASGLRVWNFLDGVSGLGEEGPEPSTGASSQTGCRSMQV